MNALLITSNPSVRKVLKFGPIIGQNSALCAIFAVMGQSKMCLTAPKCDRIAGIV